MLLSEERQIKYCKTDHGNGHFANLPVLKHVDEIEVILYMLHNVWINYKNT